MAIIVCPDCGTQFSDTAPACPHCGRPNFAQARPQQPQQPGPGAPYQQPGAPYQQPGAPGWAAPEQGPAGYPPPYGQQQGPGGQYQQPGMPYAGGAYGAPYGGGHYPPRPDNYLWQGIAVTVCCCLPLGIVSLIYSSQVTSKYDRGDFAGAMEASENARKFAVASAVVTAAILFLLMVISGINA
jgi:DNA-directed RNA polymerase subunit RPC12/RpoP